MRIIFPRPVGFRLRPAVVACLLSLLAACGGSEPPARATAAETIRPPGPATAAVRIAFLGDSLSAGHGVAEADAFPAVVGSLLGDDGHPVEVVNAGVSGDTSAGGLSRLDWVLKSDPRILVVELGANDALRGQPLDNTERNLRQIVRRARGAGVRVLLLGMDVPTNYGPDYTGSFAELYRRIAREEAVELVPGFMREVGVDPTLMQPDGLHPTVEGHRALARELVPPLLAMLDALPERPD